MIKVFKMDKVEYLDLAQVKEKENVLTLRVVIPKGHRLVKPVEHGGRPEDLVPGIYYMLIAVYANTGTIESTWYKVWWADEYPPEDEPEGKPYPCSIEMEEPLLTVQ